MQIKILAVEDDPHIARLLALELGRLGYSLRTVGTAAEALVQLRSAAPNLMLLDLGLPDRDGADVLRELRASGDALPVICLTARDQAVERVGGLRAGADDYIVKPFDISELDARIRAVLRRSDRGAPQELVIGGLRLTADETRVLGRDGPLGFTPREVHVLRRLMKNAGRVVTKAQLTETLAALNEDIGEKTVEVYVHRIRQKIQDNDVEIVTVRGFGYLLRAIGLRRRTTMAVRSTTASLRRRLLMRVALPLLGLFALDGALSAWAARHYANHVYDRWLYDSAQSLAQQVRLTRGQAALNLPRVAQEMFEWDAEDRILFRVEGSRSGLIAGHDVPLHGAATKSACTTCATSTRRSTATRCAGRC